MPDLKVLPCLPECPSCLWWGAGMWVSQVLGTASPLPTLTSPTLGITLPGDRRSGSRSCRWPGRDRSHQACTPCLQTAGTSHGHAHQTAPGTTESGRAGVRERGPSACLQESLLPSSPQAGFLGSFCLHGPQPHTRSLVVGTSMAFW